jgi:flagellar protein FlaF
MSHNAYAMTQQATEAPRDLEIRAIAFVTRQLTAANQPDAELITRIRALNVNMQMWTLLVDDLSQPDNALPEVLKARYISLGLFAKRRSLAALMDRSDLSVLIQLNTDVLDALEYQRQSVPA